MADNSFPSLLLLLIISCFIFSPKGFQFNVGGRNGWVVNPSENYNQWAERLRFQVNDTLFFKYIRGSDSVLVVNRDDYDKCNTDNPIAKLEDGSSIFKFDRSGPFYSISGNKTNCERGQKLIIVVLAVRNRSSPTPTPSISTPPAASPPGGPAPIPPPDSAPVPGAPVPSPEDSSPAPGTSPLTPSLSPPSPTTSSPPSASTTPRSGLPAFSPPGSNSSPPPPASGAGPAFTASALSMSTVSLVLTLTLVVFIM